MINSTKIFAITIVSVLTMSCSRNSTNKDIEIWSKKYCKLERLDFQEVTDTIKVKKNGEVSGGVIANGKIILSDKISLDSVGASIRAGNKTFIDRSTLRIVKVSQDFYQNYASNRKSLCDLMEGIRNGIVTSDDGKKRAEKLYLDIVESFSGLEKKNT